MNIVVTGAGGFIGRNVVAYAEKVGHVVIPSVLDLEYREKQGWPEADAVIHCAGVVGGIAFNLERPAVLMDTNLRFLMNALSIAYQSNIKRFVNLGSTCAYPDIRFSSTCGMTPAVLWSGRPEESNAPYGIAKRAGMELVSAWRKQYGIVGNNLILANVYGPGVRGSATAHVIPALIERFLNAVESGAGEVSVWGTGRAVREFLHVEDAARAIVDVGLTSDISEPLNIGGESEITIAQLADMIAELTGFTGRVVWDESQPDSLTRRRLDNAPLKSTGFTHAYTLYAGLKNTVEWMKRERCAKRATATVGV